MLIPNKKDFLTIFCQSVKIYETVPGVEVNFSILHDYFVIEGAVDVTPSWFCCFRALVLQFRYTVESNQLTFLQLHSDKATQKIIYHCLNSTAWKDKTNDDKHSIKLLGDNEREYKATTPRKHRPIVLSDDCKVRLPDSFILLIRYEIIKGNIFFTNMGSFVFYYNF